MKPTLTPDLREKFFAQYWKQRVFLVKDEYNDDYDIDGNFQDAHDCEKDRIYALLRHLASLTDNEAIEVAKIVWPKHKNLHTHEEGRWYVLRERTTSPREHIHLIDYLRSIGIALPYFGHSVEELCAAGWVKLIENKT